MLTYSRQDYISEYLGYKALGRPLIPLHHAARVRTCPPNGTLHNHEMNEGPG